MSSALRPVLIPLPSSRPRGGSGAAHSVQGSVRRSESGVSRFSRCGGNAGADAADGETADSDNSNSQLSFSNASSPSQDVGDSRDSEARDADDGGGAQVLPSRSPCKISRQLVQDTLLDEGLRVVKEMVASQNDGESGFIAREQSSCDSYNESKVQVIASSGGNIIAVANPALSMSPAIPSDSTESSISTFLRGGSSLILKQEVISPVPSPAVPNTKIE